MAGFDLNTSLARLIAQQLMAGVPLLKSYATGSFQVPTGQAGVMVTPLTLTSSQTLTLQGTARLRVI